MATKGPKWQTIDHESLEASLGQMASIIVSSTDPPGKELNFSGLVYRLYEVVPKGSPSQSDFDTRFGLMAFICEEGNGMLIPLDNIKKLRPLNMLPKFRGELWGQLLAIHNAMEQLLIEYTHQCDGELLVWPGGSTAGLLRQTNKVRDLEPSEMRKALEHIKWPKATLQQGKGTVYEWATPADFFLNDERKAEFKKRISYPDTIDKWFDDTRCRRCGDCCNPVVLGTSKADVAKRGNSSAAFVSKHWHRLSHAKARKLYERLRPMNMKGVFFYLCDCFDPDTHICHCYDERPAICRAYPRYNRKEWPLPYYFMTPNCVYRERRKERDD